jgi:hypothetical protein
VQRGRSALVDWRFDKATEMGAMLTVFNYPTSRNGWKIRLLLGLVVPSDGDLQYGDGVGFSAVRNYGSHECVQTVSQKGA